MTQPRINSPVGPGVVFPSAGGSGPLVAIEIFDFDDPTRDVFLPLLAGHTYMILWEQVVANDQPFLAVAQVVGDPTQQVSQYGDGNNLPVPADVRLFGNIVIGTGMSNVFIGVAPYFTVRDAPVQLEIVPTPGPGQTTGQIKAYLFDWPASLIANVVPL